MPAGDKTPKRSPLGKPVESLKARVNASERRTAEKLGGRRQPLSGAMEGHKGDIKLKDFLLDKKETKGTTMILHGQDLTKITREADGEGRTPGMVIRIEGVPKTVANEWVLIPLSKFAEMIDVTD